VSDQSNQFQIFILAIGVIVAVLYAPALVAHIASGPIY
jgi:hypothetical protein